MPHRKQVPGNLGCCGFWNLNIDTVKWHAWSSAIMGHTEPVVGHWILSGKTRKGRADHFSVLLRVHLQFEVKGKVY